MGALKGAGAEGETGRCEGEEGNWVRKHRIAHTTGRRMWPLACVYLLRLWLQIGPGILKQVAEVYRKVRSVGCELLLHVDLCSAK